MWQRARKNARFHSTSGFRAVLTLFRQTGPRVDGSTQAGGGVRQAHERALVRARAAASELEGGGRTGAAVQRRSLGITAEAGGAAQRRADAVAGAGHRPPVERRRDRASHGRDRIGRAARLRAPSGRGGRGCARPRRRRLRRQPVRCASAAGSGTAFTGRFARPAPRRTWRRNISPPWRPRSTSAKSRPATASTWCWEAAICSMPGSAAPRHSRCSWSAGPRAARPNGSTPPAPTTPAPVVSSGMIWPVAGPDHLLFRLSLSSDPAFHPLPRGRRLRRQLGQPDRRRRGRAGRGGRLGRRLRPRGQDRASGRSDDGLRPYERDRRRAGRLCARRAVDRLCRLVRPVDRPAPAFRGSARTASRSTRWRFASPACRSPIPALPMRSRRG